MSAITTEPATGAVSAPSAPATPKQADPGPIGLAAIGGSAFMLSVFNAGLIDRKAFPILFGVALAYGGVVLLLAGVWELRVGNTFAGLAFTTFAGFFLSFWALEQFYLKEIAAASPANLGRAVGLFILPWAIFTTYMFVASLRTTAALATVFALAIPTLWLLCLGYFGLHVDHKQVTNELIKAAGWFGILTAVACWYASFAGVVNATFGRMVLPVKSLKPITL
jgi:uncharacterized protein